MAHKVKQVLKEHFHSAAEVVELEVRQKYMVTETHEAKVNIDLNQQQAELNPQHRFNNMQVKVMPPPQI